MAELKNTAGGAAAEQKNAAERKEPFVVMAKPVGSRCNMRCAYCYYLEKGRFSEHEKQSRMSFELLERMIKQTIAGALEAESGGEAGAKSYAPTVSFVWHGGEPTLAGLDFYKKAVALERKYLPKGALAWNNLQTNGLLINDEWCRFLKDNHFDVGLSIDGSEAVHDQNRRDLGGKGTWRRIRASLDRLRKAGIEPDLLCTVNSASAADPLGVYRALRETGAGWVQFIPIVVREDGGEGSAEAKFSKESVSPEGYGEFLASVFREWSQNDLGRMDVQLFAEMARIMAGGEASLCWMAPTCGRVLICEEDGAVYSCDHFVDDGHRIGSLKKNRLESLANSKVQFAFGDAKRTSLTAECRACPYLRFCNGGCPKDRFGESSDGEDGQYYLCRGLKSFFAQAVPVLEKIIDMSRRGLKPEAIMAELRRESGN